MKAIAAPSRRLQQDKRRSRRCLPVSSPTPAVRIMAPFLGGLPAPLGPFERRLSGEATPSPGGRVWVWGCVGPRL